MKRMTFLKAILISALLTGFSGFALADDTPFNEALLSLQSEWAHINYQVEADKKEAGFEVLAQKAENFVASYPKRAEAHIWHGIILSTWAGAKGGLGALGLVKDARAELMAAMDLDPEALNGSAYTSLGSLYYQVPGWPLAFGDDDQAKVYLEKALAINPEGIDPNYFYADYLLEQGEYNRAKAFFEKVLQAKDRPHRQTADAGRRHEAKMKLKEVARHI